MVTTVTDLKEFFFVNNVEDSRSSRIYVRISDAIEDVPVREIELDEDGDIILKL